MVSGFYKAARQVQGVTLSHEEQPRVKVIKEVNNRLTTVIVATSSVT